MRRLVAAVALLTGAIASDAQAAPAPFVATLRVTVDGISQAGGTLRVGLYDEATFPALNDTPLFRREIPRIAGNVAVTFDRLPPGTYAVKVLQDVNNDGRAEAGEPAGISNGAARDNFDAAAVTLQPGINMAIIHLR